MKYYSSTSLEGLNKSLNECYRTVNYLTAIFGKIGDVCDVAVLGNFSNIGLFP